MEDYRVTQTGDEIQEILNQSPIDTADIAGLKEADALLDGRLETVEGKIPAGASEENPLTDKQYVDDSIASASATFRGTYNEVEDLELTTAATHAEIAAALADTIDVADNNDYCFVQIPTSDATPTEIGSIERYKFVTGTGWEYEYTLNNSGFTAVQWAAINSGITSGLVTKLIDLPTNAELTTLLNGKANAADVYTKSETYNKDELDSMITTPDVQYVSVTATAQTTSVTDVLPVSGASDTIYRVGSWDGTQYNADSYSEYAWNGASYVLLNVKNTGIATGSDFDNPTAAQRALLTTVGAILDGCDAFPTAGSVKPVQSGGVFNAIAEAGVINISEMNKVDTTPAVYSSLSEALAAVPSTSHRGGMSIKFIQLTPATYNVVKTEGLTEQPTGTEVQEVLAVGTGSYTAEQLSGITLPSAVGNSVTYWLAVTADEVTTYTTWVITYVSAEKQEYVQYRLMKPAWSDDDADWQGADDKPTAGSENWVKSGGVAGMGISKTNINVHKNLYNYRDSETGFYIHADGHVVSNQPNFFISGYMKVKPSTSYYLSRGTNSAIGSASTYMAEYDASFTKVKTTSTNGKTITTTSNTVYLRISGFAAYKNTAMLTEGSAFASFEDYSPINYPIFIDQVKDADFANILKTPTFYKEFAGADTTLKSYIVKFREGRIYKIFFNTPSWSCANIGTGTKFYVYKYLNGTSKSIYNYVKADTVPNVIRVHADENDYYDIGVRADSDTTVIVNIVDVTESSLIKLDGNLKIGNAWVYNGTINYNDTTLDRVSTLKYQYIPLHKGDTIRLSSYDKYKLSVMYNNNGTWSVVSYPSGLVAYTVANDGQYVICVIERNGLNASVDEVNDILSIDTFNPDTWNDYRNMAINNNLSDIDKLKPMITNRLLFSGANGTAITKTLNTIVGHTYRLYFLNRNWPWENIGSGNYLYLNDSSSQPVFAYTKVYYPKGFQYRDFIATDTTYTLGIRADSGTTVEVLFADITDSFDGSIVAYNGGYAKMKAIYDSLYRPSNNNNGVSRFNLIFFSDIHAGAENCRRIAEFRNTFGFSDVLHGGDDVADKFTDDNTVANNGGQSFLNIVGNHDVLKDNGIATGLEYYNKFIKDNLSQWGNVVFPEDADVNGYCYYYKDYASQKVRLIALDCMHWDATQKTWFEGVLADAATNNLSVIAASHYCPDRFPTFIKDCTFCTLWKDDVNAGLNDEAATAVANSIANDELDFICWLFGHTHRDYFVKVHNHPEQYAVGVDRGYGGLAGDDSSRESGTRYYDSFDIISVDTKSKYLTVVKIGVNSDRLMRQKNYLVFDYANHVIVHNS